ncbi:IS630 family transposase (plasmid) [Deinococcus sp. KNUC1210]|uniref:IS630 family transposase n=1 Tax=Deinococcus sp. KNUC1210 TaxID=2917691 RepID=UPI001EF06F2A|nr:IS630 family transposase [Deinococcus sp. KNUC1210]ULH18062.1 IS630 family transposase [Deinococcus sp. KNUC1210]
MHRGRQSPVPILSDDERRVLNDLVRRRQTPRGLATRAKVILLSADHPEWTLAEISAHVGLCDDTVGTWRKRFVAQRLEGLRDAPKSGAPRTIQDEAVKRVVRLTLDTLPEGETQWSTRGMAQVSGMTQSAVHRIWRVFGLRPHLVSSFTLSKDPLLIEKVRDIVGLYLAPPDRALVLCIDEKPQIQALERGSATFPMLPGQPEATGPTYIRHGTTTLIAALNAKVGSVIGQCYPQHRAEEFRAFLDVVHAQVPQGLEVHIILDNYITHKTKTIQNWLLAHPNVHFHFTPTSSSWLNLVESWFSLLSRKRLQRGNFTSKDELEQAIEAFISRTNDAPKPFVWTRSADDILANIKRFCERHLPLDNSQGSSESDH